MAEEGLGLFPDAVTQRGRKHLRELVAMVDQGHRAVLVYCVAHTGIERVAPAWNIDPAYADSLIWAMQSGVEVFAYGADISLTSLALVRRLPVQLNR